MAQSRQSAAGGPVTRTQERHRCFTPACCPHHLPHCASLAVEWCRLTTDRRSPHHQRLRSRSRCLCMPSLLLLLLHLLLALFLLRLLLCRVLLWLLQGLLLSSATRLLRRPALPSRLPSVCRPSSGRWRRCRRRSCDTRRLQPPCYRPSPRMRAARRPARPPCPHSSLPLTAPLLLASRTLLAPPSIRTNPHLPCRTTPHSALSPSLLSRLPTLCPSLRCLSRR